jgi:histidinol phosphatase-like PHP family hydrolase
MSFTAVAVNPLAENHPMLQQDLHIHTTFSSSDDSVVPEQTIALVAAIQHARIVGISDHFECLVDGPFDAYEKQIRQVGLKLGIEVDGHPWAREAAGYAVDYFIYHCRDREADYRSLDTLLATGKPVIVAHPNILNTDLRKVPAQCLIEINNRYVWRTDWQQYYGPFIEHFNFIIGSDAHQPNWLSQSAAQYAAARLGVEEHLVFSRVR